jgi:hypothetical protein
MEVVSPLVLYMRTTLLSELREVVGSMPGEQTSGL